MPTPFQHLVYAEQICHHPSLPSAVRQSLRQAPGGFLLGNVAPDVQAITGQGRTETHFYRLSDPPLPSAAEKFLMAYPELAQPQKLSVAHAAFVSGYLVHLTWDEVWAEGIFIPYFRDASRWSDRKAYFVHHNALRVQLDREAYSTLRSAHHTVAYLRRVAPDGWLPSVPDTTLREWRDLIAGQLEDPATVRTIEVFARRMQMPYQEFERVVDAVASGSDETMGDISGVLARYEACGLEASLQTLMAYWGIADQATRSADAERACAAFRAPAAR